MVLILLIVCEISFKFPDHLLSLLLCAVKYKIVLNHCKLLKPMKPTSLLSFSILVPYRYFPLNQSSDVLTFLFQRAPKCCQPNFQLKWHGRLGQVFFFVIPYYFDMFSFISNYTIYLGQCILHHCHSGHALTHITDNLSILTLLSWRL